MKRLLPPSWQRWSAWAGALGLFFSGIALALPGWLGPQGEGPVWDRLRSWSVGLHGALGMAFLLLLGSFGAHVRDGLKARRNLAWGWALLFCLAVLVLSAWGLYYLSEDWKDPVAKAHLYAGLALPILIFVHALRGRRKA